MESLAAVTGMIPELSSPSATGNKVGEHSFTTVFSSMLDSMSHYQENAAQQLKDIELGRGEVGINDLMVSLQKATVTLQLGVQVRNKMIAAYNEVMNMSV